MKLDKIYEEKVYAGVLGKIIGVYLGRPFEGWPYERIIKELGPINYYVNEAVGVPLIVTDDDITGTFTFLRSLPENKYNFNVSSKQIGDTWLNNLIERETVLWWGGKGNSTEHTAYENLKQGIHAPESGSIKTNGKVIAEQIGAQIFIDGWAMVCPGDPEKAVDLAGRAARVSHDGEAMYGAQIVAAIESYAFIESDIFKIIENSKNLIPKDSTIYKLISDIQNWHSSNADWQLAREKIATNYGYDKFLGNCHMVPNHALIIMSLLYGDDDFQKTLMIVNTCGWDTDCNSGNVGCILGIKNGLSGIDNGPDWRTPIKDIMYCPTANGGQTITDALTESYKVINIARKMNNIKEIEPKNGARFHFEMPGSVQGWKEDFKNNKNISTNISNIENKTSIGERSLAISYNNLAKGVNSEVYIDTFFPEELTKLKGYAKDYFFHYNFISSPIIYSGQTIQTNIESSKDNDFAIHCSFFIKIYVEHDKLSTIYSEKKLFKPNNNKNIEWKIPDTEGNPISQLGICIESDNLSSGKIIMNFLKISGEAKTSFFRPGHITSFKKGIFSKQAIMWKNSWVKALDHWEHRWAEAFRITNNHGRGMIITGTHEWKNYTITSNITYELVESGGLAVRIQGLLRYYALEFTRNNKLRLVKMLNGLKILKEIDFNFKFQKEYELSLRVNNNHLSGLLDGKLLLEFEDTTDVLEKGAIGFIVESGTQKSQKITIS